MDICVDFDGTCVTNEFPMIGKDIGAVPVLKRLVEAGHRIILFTMRSDRREVISTGEEIHPEPGSYLTDALNWFKEKGIPLHGVNQNPDQDKWTDSPKAYGHIYIDDAALGCPKRMHPEISELPYVNWIGVEYMLEKEGLLNRTSDMLQYCESLLTGCGTYSEVEAILWQKGKLRPERLYSSIPTTQNPNASIKNDSK